jgi:hypothetical protein
MTRVDFIILTLVLAVVLAIGMYGAWVDLHLAE